MRIRGRQLRSIKAQCSERLKTINVEPSPVAVVRDECAQCLKCLERERAAPIVEEVKIAPIVEEVKVVPIVEEIKTIPIIEIKEEPIVKVVEEPPKKKADSVVGWLLARRELELAEDKLTNTDTYRAYQAWCETAGEKAKSIKIMAIQLNALGLPAEDKQVKRDDGSRFKVKYRDLSKRELDRQLKDYIV
jgi:hypothetical protein